MIETQIILEEVNNHPRDKDMLIIYYILELFYDYFNDISS